MPEWLGEVVQWLRLGWGDLFGVLASLISVLGVPTAVWTAWRARTAAQSAEQAARATQLRLAAFDTVVTISTAVERLQALKALHRDGRWELALDRYAMQRRELIAIRERDTVLSEEERAVIQTAILLLAQMEEAVERARCDGADAVSLNRMLGVMIDDLQSLLQRKQARSMESGHGG